MQYCLVGSGRTITVCRKLKEGPKIKRIDFGLLMDTATCCLNDLRHITGEINASASMSSALDSKVVIDADAIIPTKFSNSISKFLLCAVLSLDIALIFLCTKGRMRSALKTKLRPRIQLKNFLALVLYFSTKGSYYSLIIGIHQLALLNGYLKRASSSVEHFD